MKLLITKYMYKHLEECIFYQQNSERGYVQYLCNGYKNKRTKITQIKIWQVLLNIFFLIQQIKIIFHTFKQNL